MLKQEPQRRPFGWQYTEQPVEKPGKAVVEAPKPVAKSEPVAAAPLSSDETETLAAQIVPLQTGTPVTPLPKKPRRPEES